MSKFGIMDCRNYSSVSDRRNAVEKELSISLPNIASFSFNEVIASSRNCENMIGATHIPLGIAGPVAIQNSESKIQKYYIPLATTEGALVASVNRGCKAITQSGGAMVDVVDRGTTRAPAFRVNSLSKGNELAAFLKRNFSKLQDIATSTSHHLKLLSYTVSGVGPYRYVRFVFNTGDAMGLNMVTIASDALAAYITKQTNIPCVALSGNVCTDKKAAWINSLDGRGIQVRVECTLHKNVLTNTLKTTANKIYDTWLSKCMIGSAVAGSIGFNAQYANVIAALFIATGQDPAHIVEGSIGMTTTDIHDDGILVCSVWIPNLMIGVVGGGTQLATQKEALSILGLGKQTNSSRREEFAGVIGAAVLAGEISLLASLAEGSLAQAHERLGRGKRI